MPEGKGVVCGQGFRVKVLKPRFRVKQNNLIVPNIRLYPQAIYCTLTNTCFCRSGLWIPGHGVSILGSGFALDGEDLTGDLLTGDLLMYLAS